MIPPEGPDRVLEAASARRRSVETASAQSFRTAARRFSAFSGAMLQLHDDAASIERPSVNATGRRICQPLA
ncbi:MAG: hypothetical protein COT28_19485 [Methylobacterium sp. CG08_land_8_20_14_0_20_71_15]|nr:MAG: hypothetical protein COT56_16990 [Methylobacterium sp. CG09_land_8_20_14_0_10_71_15]PIU11469.1 MAG: hypothetical protein COT28_19485 [Methylobacterium sp. CG08_land_8_20_14_0_20_71_15]